jgi:hypothetical protein
LVSVAAVFLLVVAPLTTLLLPALASIGTWPAGGPSAYALLAMLALLMLSAMFHARRCPMPNQQAHKVSWPPCQIDLAKQTLAITPPSSREPAMELVIVGATSVAVYHWLASQTYVQHKLVIGIVVALAMGMWLCMCPLGRTLGQAWRLRTLEAQRGVRVRTSRIQWLQQERQRHWVGRRWPGR